MPIHLVKLSEPSSGEAALLRIKRMRKEDGALMCNRCGGCTSLTLYNGLTVKDGRIKLGTAILRHVCAECWKRGITQFMLPDPPKLVKPTNPRKRRLKLVK